jgi:hypothetical protein
MCAVVYAALVYIMPQNIHFWIQLNSISKNVKYIIDNDH